jgi:hypothetical protein
VPEKETDEQVKAKKNQASALARARRGLGATINTSGTGVPSGPTTDRATLLGD